MPVALEMLGNAKTKTIYLRKGALTKASHDKEYTFNLRFMKTALGFVNMKMSIISILSFDDFDDMSAIQTQTDERLQWSASLASNSQELGIRITVQLTWGICLELLVFMKISPPDVYLHQLDRWMRSQYTAMSIGGDAGSLPWLNKLQGPEVELFKSKSLLEVEAVKKDCENGGKVFGAEIDMDMSRMPTFPAAQTTPYDYPGRCYEIGDTPSPQRPSPSRDGAYERHASVHYFDAYETLRELYSHMPFVWGAHMQTWYDSTSDEHDFVVYYRQTTTSIRRTWLLKRNGTFLSIRSRHSVCSRN